MSKPFNIPFIAHVHKDRGILISPAPVFVIDQVPLLKSLVTLGVEVEVIKYLGEVPRLVPLPLLVIPPWELSQLLGPYNRRRKPREDFGQYRGRGRGQGEEKQRNKKATCR